MENEIWPTTVAAPLVSKAGVLQYSVQVLEVERNTNSGVGG